eukprot:gene18428-24132_t
MRCFVIVNFFVFLIWGSIFSQNVFSDGIVSQDRLEKIIPEFEKYIEKAQVEWGAPGVAVGIVKDGKIVYLKGFGVTEVGGDKKINEHTVFQIASLTKNFLVHLYAKLVQNGQISWDDPVIKYLPTFFVGNKEVTSQFTIRDLLSHRSGLPSFSGDSLWYLNFSTDEIIEGIGKIPLKYPFRSKYGYQNQLFGIASIIAEKITGKTIEQLFKEYFFIPLKLNDSSVGLNAIKPEKSFFGRIFGTTDNTNIAYPHDDRGKRAHKIELSQLIYRFPGSSGVNMSINNLAQWMIFMINKGVHNGNTLIDDKQYTQLITPHIDCGMKYDDVQFPGDRYSIVKYGMGHFIMEYGEGEKKLRTVGHMGGFCGTRSLMVVAPEEKLGIVVLSNYGSFRVSFLPEAIHNKFMDLYLGISTIDWSKRLRDKFISVKENNKRYKAMQRLQKPKKAKLLKEYVGIYKNNLYGEIIIQSESSSIYLMMRGKKIPLEHFNGDEFTFPGYLASEAYSDSDIGYIDFGSRNGEKLDLCAVSTLEMHEGKDHGLFERVGG